MISPLPGTEAVSSLAHSPWRRRTARPDARWRIVCFPHAGGAASFFGSWSAEFGADVEVVACQYPGREDRLGSPTVTRMTPLVASLVAHLRPLLDRPVVLFGHSMGALVAYEVARALGDRPPVPVRLAVSGAPPPGTAAPRDIHLRDDAGVLAEIERLGGPTEALRLSAELRELAMPSIRGDFELLSVYRRVHGAPLRCPLSTLTGDADVDVPPDRMAGWAAMTDGPCTAHVLSGGHFALAQPGPRRATADALRALMAQ